MPFFKNVFKSKDGATSSSKAKGRKGAQKDGPALIAPQKPRWEDAWLRKDVEPEEVQELLRGCTAEIKARALDMPFLLLPFRPTSDPSAARTFIRNYFDPNRNNMDIEKDGSYHGEYLNQELRLTEPMVLCSVMKWCWSRLMGGVVTWEAYELFRIGEQGNMAHDAFATFIPISVESDARTRIIFDFFDLMAAIAAHGKNNGLAGRKLSRLAGWWAFEHTNASGGFDGGYRSWANAADATSHLFFAYLRSLSPGSVRGVNGISALPLSLQTLVESTEYPPTTSSSLQTSTTKIAMIVDNVSPTPFALLRRAKHFEYRDDDQALQEFSDYEDPIQALTDECRRVLKSISSANQSAVSTIEASTSLRDASWSRFEDIGFSDLGTITENDGNNDRSTFARKPFSMRSAPHSTTNDTGRPVTPSWADFLSSGFVDDNTHINQGPSSLLLPSDKILPPLNTSRSQSSQSLVRPGRDENELEPGELASITVMNLDDSFWWVWITSLAGEEPTERKSVFGRCALIETNIQGGMWLIVEEIVKGAAPEPEDGAYIAEKKGRFSFTRRGRISRAKSTARKPLPSTKIRTEPYVQNNQSSPMSKTSIGTDQHARIQAAAAALQQKHKWGDDESLGLRRARHGDAASTKTNSVFTLQPVIMSEAAPAMKWANSYDKHAIRAAYLGNNFAGRGSATDLLGGANPNESATPLPPNNDSSIPRKESHGPQRQETNLPRDTSDLSNSESARDRNLPALPQEKLEELAPLTPLEKATSTIPPAPLPIRQAADAGYPNNAANEITKEHLPSTPPKGHPLRIERKPLASLDNNRGSEHTAGLESFPSQEVPNGYASPTSSPASKKSSAKKETTGGFMGFFGKKKVPQSPPAAKVQPTKVNEQAAAAARAALYGPPKSSSPQPRQVSSQTLSPPQQSSLGRRLSSLGRKKTPARPPVLESPPPPPPPQNSPPPLPHQDERHQLEHRPANTEQEQAAVATPRDENPYRRYYDSEANLSHVDSMEQQDADHEFQQFDQVTAPARSGGIEGPLYDQPTINQDPMDDQPHFDPQESPEQRSSAFISDAGRSVEPSEAATLEEEDRTSEKSINLNRQVSPVQDRWAQIRKNAAERAQRQSEEQSMPSPTDKTDDGETSGEETIESRVARIKARVAELTGNMDTDRPARR